MTALQAPRSENAVSYDSKTQTGTFAKYWVTFFVSIAKRFSTADTVIVVASPDAAAAPGAYNQAHIQTIVAELNETKQQLNSLLTALRG